MHSHPFLPGSDVCVFRSLWGLQCYILGVGAFPKSGDIMILVWMRSISNKMESCSSVNLNSICWLSTYVTRIFNPDFLSLNRFSSRFYRDQRTNVTGYISSSGSIDSRHWNILFHIRPMISGAMANDVLCNKSVLCVEFFKLSSKKTEITDISSSLKIAQIIPPYVHFSFLSVPNFRMWWCTEWWLSEIPLPRFIIRGGKSINK
jgi:hypothetical protein